MLGNSPYYRESFNRLSAAFMSLFADISIQKRDAGSNVVKTVPVPIAYGPRQKWLAELQGNPDLNRPVGITLPRIGVEMIGFSYATDRKLNSTNQFSAQTANGDSSSSSFVYVPVPIDIAWRLDIMTNGTDDANQIIEQIVPFFTPEWVNRVKLVDELGIEFNMPVTFQSAALSDSYSNGDNSERRIMVWSLGFSMQAYLIGPPRTSKIIKISKVNLYTGVDANTDWASANSDIKWVYQANTSPGMTANGQPTTDPSQSVDPLTIKATDDWGYAVQITDDTDAQ